MWDPEKFPRGYTCARVLPGNSWRSSWGYAIHPSRYPSPRSLPVTHLVGSRFSYPQVPLALVFWDRACLRGTLVVVLTTFPPGSCNPDSTRIKRSPFNSFCWFSLNNSLGSLHATWRSVLAPNLKYGRCRCITRCTGADYTRLVTKRGGDRPARAAEEGRGARRSGGDGRRKRASSTKTSRWPHATTRGPEQFTRATCAARAIPTIFVLHIRKGKGSFSLSLACRRLEGERTIAGAERRRQLRSMMLFLGFWNSLAPTTAPPRHPRCFACVFFSLLPSISPRTCRGVRYRPAYSSPLCSPPNWILLIAESFAFLRAERDSFPSRHTADGCARGCNTIPILLAWYSAIHTSKIQRILRRSLAQRSPPTAGFEIARFLRHFAHHLHNPGGIAKPAPCLKKKENKAPPRGGVGFGLFVPCRASRCRTVSPWLLAFRHVPVACNGK